jgi:prepilin-type processing-associated H-X9-DG protein
LRDNIYPVVLKAMVSHESAPTVPVRAILLEARGRERTLLHCPACQSGQSSDYHIVAAIPRRAIEQNPRDSVIAFDRLGNHPSQLVNVLYADGSVGHLYGEAAYEHLLCIGSEEEK